MSNKLNFGLNKGQEMLGLYLYTKQPSRFYVTVDNEVRETEFLSSDISTYHIVDDGSVRKVSTFILPITFIIHS